MNFREILEREQAKLDGYTANERAGLDRVAAAHPGQTFVPCPRCDGRGYTIRHTLHRQEQRALCDACGACGRTLAPAGLAFIHALAALQVGVLGPAKSTQAELDEWNRLAAQREAAVAAEAEKSRLHQELRAACFAAMGADLSDEARQVAAARVVELARKLGELDEQAAGPAAIPTTIETQPELGERSAR